MVLSQRLEPSHIKLFKSDPSRIKGDFVTPISPERKPRLRIRVLVLDVDGVLTDGRVLLDEQGRENKSLCYRDIDAVFQARREGLRVALVTGERSPIVDVIACRLAIRTVVSGAKDKALALEKVCSRLRTTMDRVCYIGDSDRDAPALRQVGLGLAPADASPQARLSVHKVLTSRGGYGAVAEALTLIRCLNTGGQEDAEVSLPPAERVVAPSVALEQSVITALQQSITVKQAVLETLSDRIATTAEWIVETLLGGKKLLLFGEKHDAALGQHIAAEFAARFENGHRAWPAIVLSSSSSLLSASVHDYDREMSFARQVEELGQRGDLALIFSVSGDSAHVLQGAITARARGLRVVGLTGNEGGHLARLCDLAVCVPSSCTPRIQECHIAISHAICEAVEAALVGKQ